MLGFRSNSDDKPYTADMIPNDYIARRAVKWSKGKIRHAVKAQSRIVIARIAKQRKCKITEVMCEVCGFPLCTQEQIDHDEIVIVEKMQPHGFYRHPERDDCDTNDEIHGEVENDAVEKLFAKS